MQILFLVVLAHSSPKLDLIVDGSLYTDDGMAIEQPCIAVFWDGDLYIGDRAAGIMFVRRQDGSLVTFGRSGRGPGEFKGYPENLFVRDGQLVIEEWNRWREYVFDKEGNFLSGRLLERFVYEYHGDRYRKVFGKEAIKVGWLYEKLGSGQYVCRMESKDYKGLHLTRGYLKEGPDGTVVAFKKGGWVEVYDQMGKRIHRMAIPLEIFKKDVTIDKLSTTVTLAAGASGKAYDGGAPLLDGAIESLSRVWVLGKNEKVEGQGFLFEVDLIKQAIKSRTDLDQPYTRLTWNQGVLALTSPGTGIVATYNTE